MNEEIRDQLRQLNKEQLIDLIADLYEQIAELKGIVQTQAARLQPLEDQRARNSGNSGKPPSSDGLKKKPRSLREKGKRKAGGQKGHKGHTLDMVTHPDHSVSHALTTCPHCQTDVRAVSVERVEKRQVFDLPEVRLEVTEHQGEVKTCPCCGEKVKARFPEGVDHAVQYGTRIKAQAVYLNTYQLLPLARIGELFADFYGHAPSAALILGALQQTQRQIQPALDAIEALLLQSNVVHNDETGMRVEGKLRWLHVTSTDRLTAYTMHQKRGQEAIREIGILPRFKGVSVHDGWASYFQFDCDHALCNAHHLRELRFIEEQYQQRWAGDMAQLLRDAKQEVAACPEGQTALAPERIACYHQQYEALLKQGFKANLPPETPPPKKRGRKKQSPPKNLLDRLQKYQQETLAFIADFRVPFDNNLAERDVRMMKVKQKVSGTFRTQQGAEMFCDLRAYISTARKQGQSVICALHHALLGQPFTPA